jgi:ubiquinone/menaquinone biosynthesis C-methylase UbiE
MKSVEQTVAFSQAGDSDGVLAFLYLYNALQITSVLKPGDRVLDLACGPANQLVQVARLNPGVRFVGLDASLTMLQCAESTLEQAGVVNVELVQGDMTDLKDLEDASMDGVICTMSLHHLADLAALCATLREVHRVLNQKGRFYLMDFGRLKRLSTQRFLADDLRQSEQFTADYFNSMRAAFSVKELTTAVAPLGSDVRRHVTVLAPFIVVFKSSFQLPMDPQTLKRAKDAFENLSAAQKSNFRSLANWFKGSGYTLPCELG